MANRLNLDFYLYTSEERQEYVNKYLSTKLPDDDEYVVKYGNKHPFPFPSTPTAAELETMADYVLYGKTKPSEGFDVKKDGTTSIVDAGYVQIEVRNSPWTKKRPESLDTLISDAQETGNPIEIQYDLAGGIRGKKDKAPPYRIKRETFSRKVTRTKLTELGDEALLREYEDLWRRIDETDYTVTAYSLRTGRRKLPIRDELEQRLTDEQKARAIEHAAALNMFTWGKLRKHLVELRQQQYVLRDGFSPTVGRPRQNYYAPNPGATRGFHHVLPAGQVNYENEFSRSLFMEEIGPEHFTSYFQDRLLKYLLKQDKRVEKGRQPGDFDFRDPDSVALLIYARNDLVPSEDMDVEHQQDLQMLLDTLRYYIRVSKMEPLHREIITMKANNQTNETIAKYINKKYDKTYSPNYISTIFRSKCCGGIAEAAIQHWNILDKLAGGKSEFKRCSTCNLLLLRDANNYVRKARAKDGLASRCKSCDKKVREEKARKQKEKEGGSK